MILFILRNALANSQVFMYIIMDFLDTYECTSGDSDPCDGNAECDDFFRPPLVEGGRG